MAMICHKTMICQRHHQTQDVYHAVSELSKTNTAMYLPTPYDFGKICIVEGLETGIALRNIA